MNRPHQARDARLMGSRPEPARSGSVLGLSTTGFHEIAYVEWGPEESEVPVLCVHGLTRQGRDFDHLAENLARRRRRVVCPDLPGRGRSQSLSDPGDYALPQYCADMNALIARLGVTQVDWVGTSLGGLIGIVLAGMPGSCIRRLVVNDIGPYVSSVGLLRIGSYLGDMPRSFVTLARAERYFREILAPYGELSDEQWRHITAHSVRWDETRHVFTMLCDREIARAFRNPWLVSLNLWKYWERIGVPTLVLHGAKSDLLTHELCDEMLERNANATLHRFEECGHVPPLFELQQIKIVTDFLADKRPAGPD
ncbi:alpha/beta hydrolase (plasmid) [Bosea vaviloviae]|uniref:Alpha/beta hydrolase n=2 Tax=Bosea vaviloviae TaxID=1526658 RepID=A0A1D7UCS0_9HYPH|nr:alpha/beta hydrolase [Bosea vaviloviae]